MTPKHPAGRREGEWQGLKRELRWQLVILFGYAALLWAIEFVDAFGFGGRLDQYGVRPRELAGLPGVLLHPLLHLGLGHLVANTVPLTVLGWFVMLRNTRDWFVVGAFATVVGGLGTWLIGSHGYVVGSSGVAFGFLGYLLARGYFDRSFFSVLGSLFVGLLYGGLLFGLFPGNPGISWQCHLFGFAGGISAARLLSPRSARSSSPARPAR